MRRSKLISFRLQVGTVFIFSSGIRRKVSMYHCLYNLWLLECSMDKTLHKCQFFVSTGNPRWLYLKDKNFSIAPYGKTNKYFFSETRNLVEPKRNMINQWMIPYKMLKKNNVKPKIQDGYQIYITWVHLGKIFLNYSYLKPVNNMTSNWLECSWMIFGQQSLFSETVKPV